jgi:hypothetical protein
MSEQTIPQVFPQPTAETRSWQRLITRRNLWLFTVLSLLVFTVILWLPFGFKTTGLMDEWFIIHDWDRGGISERGQDVALFVTTGTLVMRPMDPAAFIIAHEIAPDSFLGFNLYLMATFILKGLLLYAILRALLPDNPLFSIAATLLFIIFPSDDGLFTFCGINVHSSVCLYLFAAYLMISYYQKPRLIKVIGMWLAVLVSLFTYEGAHPLFAFTPFILLWKERRINKQLVRTGILWWIPQSVAFVYAVMMFIRPETYQFWLFQRSGLNQPSVIGEMAQSILMTYRRHFGEGWIPSLSAFAPFIPAALGVVGISAAAIGGHLPLARTFAVPSKRRYVELFVIGLLVILLGYVIYIITPQRQLTWRVFYFSSIGGAICFASLAYLVARRFQAWRAVFIAVMCGLLAVAGVHALDQHQRYVDLADHQQRLLRGVAHVAPKVDEAATLVVVDETGTYRDNWSLGVSYLLEMTLRYVYDDYDMKAVICSFNPEEARFNELPELHEQCAFSDDGLHLTESGAPVKTVPYSEMAVIRYTAQGAELLPTLPTPYLAGADASGYAPDQLVDTSAPPPYRYNTLFTIAD